MNILSIQSHVAYGHVGNAAAVFPLQRIGVEVWPIHTVQFSNHTGYGSWKGRVFDAGMIGELMAGIEQRGDADFITPNQFELDYLSRRASGTLRQARDAVKAVHDIGPRAILVTSLHTQDTPEDCIDLLASNQSGCFMVRTPRLPLAVNGAGDAIAALFFAHYLRTAEIGEALSRASSAIFGVLAKTVEAGGREIQLTAAQDEIVRPSRLFEARDLGR
jgi:pyridoxal/pyridoxine/pyridoxamine kinase